MSRATLCDLVDMLRIDLGYGEEFSINSEGGLLYDVEETENLNKKFSELGSSPALLDSMHVLTVYRPDRRYLPHRHRR